MVSYLRRWSALAALTILMANFSPLLGDEGMWLFNNPPKAHLKAKYNFEPTDAWLNHLQKSSVRRFNLSNSTNESTLAQKNDPAGKYKNV